MFKKVRAIHVAVNDLEEAKKLYADNFGLEAFNSGELPLLGIKNAFLQVGDAVIEFIEPLNREEGPVSKFLDTRGEGIYMIALEVDNIDSAIESMQKKGIRLISADAESRAKGIPVYIHPKSTKGILIELVEKK